MSTQFHFAWARLHSIVGSMSNCRSRVPKPGHIALEQIDHEIIPTIILPLLLIKGEQFSYWRKYVHKYWLST